MLSEDNCLAHFGIKGQKWGIRRFQNEDGTLTEAGKQHYSTSSGGNKKLKKKYHREEKKLQKLTDRADIDKQRQLAEKHNNIAKVAAGIGAAAGVTASGLAIKEANALRAIDYSDDRINSDIGDARSARDYLMRKTSDARREYAKNPSNTVAAWYLRNDVSADYERRIGKMSRAINRLEGSKFGNELHRREVRNAYIPLGAVAAGTAAGALGVAGYNKAKSIIEKRRTTDKGHAKAVARRQEQFNKMMNTFAGTPYADLLKKQK